MRYRNGCPSAALESGIGKLYHYRDVVPIDKQTVIRANREASVS